MNYLLTGTSGFLGSIISDVLKSEKAVVMDINSVCGHRVDISKQFELPAEISTDAVVHIAGKAHSIPRTEVEARTFSDVNLEGTKNLCAAVEGLVKKPKSFIFISSVAVYGLETGHMISESTPLLGNSPYAKSKIEAENFLRKWGKINNIQILILRLPLIAGPNPPGNLGKMINGIAKGKYVSINNGKARRSVVLASDVARCIAKNNLRNGAYNLTDGYNPSFRELETVIAFQLNKRRPISIPLAFAKIIGKMGDLLRFVPFNSDVLSKMVNDLTFDSSKAKKNLDWTPNKVTENFIISKNEI